MKKDYSDIHKFKQFDLISKNSKMDNNLLSEYSRSVQNKLNDLTFTRPYKQARLYPTSKINSLNIRPDFINPKHLTKIDLMTQMNTSNIFHNKTIRDYLRQKLPIESNFGNGFKLHSPNVSFSKPKIIYDTLSPSFLLFFLESSFLLFFFF